MKVNVCDVCYHGEKSPDKPLVRSNWNINIKGRAEKIQLSVCDKHKDYFKGLTLEQARAKVEKLWGF